MKRRQSAEDILSELPDAIALIGASARLPGASDLPDYRVLMHSGESAVRPIAPDKLAASHHAGIAALPNYVAMNASLENVELFDSGFFGFTPREAMLIDPQQRHILECVWHAFENAGIIPGDNHAQRTATFTSVSFSSYLSHFILARIQSNMVDVVEAGLSNNVDYAPARVSYKLDLKGPSVAVQTACSSSLVATHMACRSLAERECDLAVVAASSITVPNGLGYLASDKGMLATDGICRPFSADATGTVFANGAGALLLKRLDEAIADGDPVALVIRGTAINNDGANRVGFTAPSIDGQSAVIAEAMGMADVTPDELCYVEAHGTGTPLGDPIEIAALHDAYGNLNQKIPLGSVKGQVGHLDTVAGLAGLLKISAAFDGELIPATLNFSSANPGLEIAERPFQLVTEPWPLKRSDHARIAGLSSFGMGGSNAHAVVQEPPEPVSSVAGRKQELFLVSGREDVDATENAGRLGSFLALNESTSLSDAAYTLRHGRKPFPARRFLVAGTIAEASMAFKTNQLHSGEVKAGSKLIFVLPGQGSQYAGLAHDLAAEEPAFARNFNRLRETLVALGGPEITNPDLTSEQVRNTVFAQTVLFASGVALGKTLQQYGILPDAYIGHSVGEVAVACLAGVLTEEDACHLLLNRAKAMNQAPPGAMIQLLCSKDQALQIIDEVRKPEGVLQISACNGPSTTIVGGDFASIDGLISLTEKLKIDTIRLRTSHAFHTPMMSAAADALSQSVDRLLFRPAAIPVISTLTGTTSHPLLLSEPDYWCRQMLNPVRFDDALLAACKHENVLFTELGPNGGLELNLPRNGTAPRTVSLLPNARGAKTPHADQRQFLNAIGRIWASGHEVDWKAFDKPFLPRRKVELPGYAFRAERHWPESEEQPSNIPSSSAHPAHPENMPRQPRPSLANDYAAPETQTEETLAELWEELLLISPIGREDDFIALGGASITALQMVQILAQKGYELTVREVFETRTLANLAIVLERGAESSSPSSVPLHSYEENEGEELDLEALATIRSRLTSS